MGYKDIISYTIMSGALIQGLYYMSISIEREMHAVTIADRIWCSHYNHLRMLHLYQLRVKYNDSRMFIESFLTSVESKYKVIKRNR